MLTESFGYCFSFSFGRAGAWAAWLGRLAARLGWAGLVLVVKVLTEVSLLLFIFVFGVAKQDLRCRGIQFLLILS